MKRKIVSLSIIFILTVTIFSGCNEQKNTETQNNKGLMSGLQETFLVDSNGGSYSAFDDNLKLTIKAGSVSETINVTVETINDPVDDPSLMLFSCFEFVPDGTTFKRPIDVIIRYNLDDLPDGVEESEIKIYLLNGDTWEPIEDSFANTAMHWAVASVSHFSKMAGGAPAPSGGSSSGNGDNGGSDDENNSAQYWFKANINYINRERRAPYCNPDDLSETDRTDYYSSVTAWWDPVSYVQYYQIKFVFNDNPPEDYAWGYSFREQDKYTKSSSWFNEGYIYHLGGNPDLKGFMGVLTTGEISCSYWDYDLEESIKIVYNRLWPEGKHGFSVFGVHDTVLDAEDLSDYEVGILKGEMELFAQDYVEGWEIWVRGVTETEE